MLVNQNKPHTTSLDFKFSSKDDQKIFSRNKNLVHHNQGSENMCLALPQLNDSRGMRVHLECYGTFASKPRNIIKRGNLN